MLAAAFLVTDCGNKASAPAASGAPAARLASPRPKPKLTKLEITDVKVGKGPLTARLGDQVWVWYKGTLADGTQFDATERPAPPASFGLVAGQLVKGWTDGIPGMKLGGIRNLSIPAKLGYGDKSPSDKIPPDSDLYFTVELAYVIHPGQENQFDITEEKIGLGPAVKVGSKVKITFRAMTLNGDLVIDQKTPESFKAGDGGVLPGLDRGVVGMKKGGRRMLLLPPDLAFGQMGAKGTVPPNSPMRFDVTLVGLE